MENSDIKRIAVVGPESTGKSWLAPRLAEYYQTVWVPEFARTYCEKLNREYTMEDEMAMFYGQLELEKQYLPRARRLLICDTTFLTIKIWSDHLFGYTPQPVLDELQTNRYDFYLLLDIDLPWEDDPLRDFPHLREHFKQVWIKELQALQAPYVVISGSGEHRLQQAIAAIDAYLNTN